MRALFQLILDWFTQTYVEPATQKLRLRAAILYLEGVRGARRALLLLCLLIFVITLIGAGLVLVPLALLLFMPWAVHTKAFVGLVIGLGYLLFPTFALASLLSEKRWMRITGANQILRKILD